MMIKINFTETEVLNKRSSSEVHHECSYLMEEVEESVGHICMVSCKVHPLVPHNYQGGLANFLRSYQKELQALFNTNPPTF